jgi:hypothetical protein
MGKEAEDHRDADVDAGERGGGEHHAAVGLFFSDSERCVAEGERQLRQRPRPIPRIIPRRTGLGTSCASRLAQPVAASTSQMSPVTSPAPVTMAGVWRVSSGLAHNGIEAWYVQTRPAR